MSERPKHLLTAVLKLVQHGNKLVPLEVTAAGKIKVPSHEEVAGLGWSMIAQPAGPSMIGPSSSIALCPSCIGMMLESIARNDNSMLDQKSVKSVG